MKRRPPCCSLSPFLMLEFVQFELCLGLIHPKEAYETPAAYTDVEPIAAVWTAAKSARPISSSVHGLMISFPCQSA